MTDFAACTVRQSRRGVEKYVQTSPRSVEAQKLAIRLSTGSCLVNGSIIIQKSAYRAAVFDVLYHVDFAKDGPLDFSAVPPIGYAQAGPTGIGRLRCSQGSERGASIDTCRHWQRGGSVDLHGIGAVRLPMYDN